MLIVPQHYRVKLPCSALQILSFVIKLQGEAPASVLIFTKTELKFDTRICDLPLAWSELVFHIFQCSLWHHLENTIKHFMIFMWKPGAEGLDIGGSKRGNSPIIHQGWSITLYEI